MRSALPDTFVGEISGKAPTGRSCKWPFLFLGLGLCNGLAPLLTVNVLKTLLYVKQF
jgi:hypothetical protein